ncbi:hypothetical protein L1987_42780 [Smallanthus sonchifolius]|uniref:Uncharacterized protein n=1 Tax=Smallanthus sonchifolius TaxID=185202 RepID=A0ACB9GJU6_9ASTR|nr:hypothetical protein L1987_42780 [Smallanthus sonchifolius]
MLHRRYYSLVFIMIASEFFPSSLHQSRQNRTFVPLFTMTTLSTNRSQRTTQKYKLSAVRVPNLHVNPIVRG